MRYINDVIKPLSNYAAQSVRSRLHWYKNRKNRSRNARVTVENEVTKRFYGSQYIRQKN